MEARASAHFLCHFHGSSCRLVICERTVWVCTKKRTPFSGCYVPKKHSSSLHLLEKTIPGKNFFSLFHCNSISQLGFYDPFFSFTNFILCPWKVANSHSCVLFWTNTEWFYCKNESLFSRTAKDAFHGTKFLNFVW